MTATARVLDIAAHLPAPDAAALCNLVRALSPVATAIGDRLVRPLGVAQQLGEHAVDRAAQGDEAAERLAVISETGSDV